MNFVTKLREQVDLFLANWSGLSQVFVQGDQDNEGDCSYKLVGDFHLVLDGDGYEPEGYQYPRIFPLAKLSATDGKVC